MTRKIYNVIIAVLIIAISACGDSGGDRAEGIEPGPPPSGGNPVTPPNPQPDDGVIHVDDIQPTDEISLSITQLNQSDTTSLTFEFLVNETKRVTDLSPWAGTFTLAKLVENPPSAKGKSWQSYIETSEDPICRTQGDVESTENQCTTYTTETNPEIIPDSARKVQDAAAIGKTVTIQADGESNGTLTDNEDGTWSYTYATKVDTPAENDLVHRACFQFWLNADAANPCVDFVPAIATTSGDGVTGTSLAEGFYEEHHARKIVNEESCNTCHDKLAIHGARTEMDFCVTCHNPGSIDANSGNSVDFKQLIHKLHFGRSLPANVDDGHPYKIWGYRNSEHDYSNTSYPQEVQNCSRCHAGEEDILFSEVQGTPLPKAITTLDGHNWVSMPTKDACESCHEKLFTENLKLNGNTPTTDHTSYTNERDCAGCHRDRGADEPGGLQANQAHRNFADELGQSLTLMITNVSQTAEGESPKVTFAIQDSEGMKLDLQNPEQMCASAKFDLRMPSDAAKDYRGRISASGTMADLVAEGNGEFSIQLEDMVGQGVDTIAAMMDFSFPITCEDSDSTTVRLDAVISYQASSAESPTDRRKIVSVERCNDCHERFLTLDQYHGGTRSVNNPEACVACHGSEFATSDRTRELGLLMHGIHGSAMREIPHKDWTVEKLQFPGSLANCTSCHEDNAYTLPLQIKREAIKVTSSTYSSAIGAVCASCHDSSVAKAHMVSAGGSIFDTSFEDANAAEETCSVCHGVGKSADVSVVHKR